MATAVAAGLITGGVVALLAPSNGSDSFVGGCSAFNLHSQNQFKPYGTLVWDAPSPTAPNHPAFAENQLITVDGWVQTRSPYITNGPPWDSNVWYHLANEAGWVTFAGVRAVQTTPDPEDGLAPAARLLQSIRTALARIGRDGRSPPRATHRYSADGKISGSTVATSTTSESAHPRASRC